MRITPLQIVQYAAYLILLAIAGTLEYFKLLPANSTAGVFLLVVGHFFGNTPMTAALVQNTQVTRENTQATAAGNAAANTIQPPTGPIHVVLHNEQPPTPSSPPVPTTESIPETPTGPIPIVKVGTVLVDAPIPQSALAGTITNTPVNVPKTPTGPIPIMKLSLDGKPLTMGTAAAALAGGTAIQNITTAINFGETAKVPAVQEVQS